ncbi:hypothetical protein ABPG72_004627 [Tetrahymena utriculariae]
MGFFNKIFSCLSAGKQKEGHKGMKHKHSQAEQNRMQMLQNQQNLQVPPLENIQGSNEERKNEIILKGLSKQTQEVHIKSNELNNTITGDSEKAKKQSNSQLQSNSKIQDNYIDHSINAGDEDDKNNRNGYLNQSNYYKKNPSFTHQNSSQVKKMSGQNGNQGQVNMNLEAQNISKVSQKEENQETNFNNNPGSKNNTESISTSQSQIKNKNYKQSNHTDNTSLDSTKVSLNGSTVTNKDDISNSQEEFANIDKSIKYIKTLDIKKRAQEIEKIITYYIQNTTSLPQNVLSYQWANEFSENIRQKIILGNPINNQMLVDANGNLKEGFQINQDYMLVSDQVWYFLHQMYGGGPHIIYDNDHSKLKKLLFKPYRLENNSNYCYMNACLQSILSIGELNTYFFDKIYLEQKDQITKKPPKFTNAYLDLLQKFQKSGANQIISPNLFKKYSQQHFDPHEQHDAQEYLRFVLGEIQDELNFPLPNKRPTEFKDSQQASKFYFKYHTSIVDRLFCGQLISKVQCQKCKYVSSTFDPFLDLSLPIESKSLKDLNSCMDLFFKPEEIDGEYKCEKCTKTSRAIKSCQLGNIPKYLVIHLKRFKMFPYKTKIKQQISYPSILDISKYYANSGNESTKYSLNGVIIHQGSADIGHYVSFNKRDTKWYFCDDDSIQECSNKDALDQEAYLLFYEKI